MQNLLIRRKGSGNNTPVKPSDRMVWMDAARGIAILLVIPTHAQGLLESLGAGFPEQLTPVLVFFQPFRIPLLVLLSGMLVGRSAAKGAKRYFNGKIRAILWPFAIWTAILIATLPGVGYDNFVQYIATEPLSVMWFLHFLFIAYAFFYLIRKLPLLPIATTFIAASHFLPSDYMVDRYALLFGVFILGHFLATTVDRWMPLIKNRLFIFTGLIVFVWLGLVSLNAYIRYDPAWIIWSLIAILSIIGILMYIPSHSKFMKSFAFVGQNSIIYYVIHLPVFNLFLRPIFTHEGVEHRTPIIITGIILALSISTALALLTRIHPLFALPFRLITWKELKDWTPHHKKQHTP